MAAAIAVKNWMTSNRIAGTLRFYGTPAEEGGAGKVYMLRERLFADVDLEMLRRQRRKGTVMNWEDRRRDLYTVHYTANGSSLDPV